MCNRSTQISYQIEGTECRFSYDWVLRLLLLVSGAPQLTKRGEREVAQGCSAGEIFTAQQHALLRLATHHLLLLKF
jgi:hypothetical protein